jgi:hypothetical protein
LIKPWTWRRRQIHSEEDQGGITRYTPVIIHKLFIDGRIHQSLFR